MSMGIMSSKAAQQGLAMLTGKKTKTERKEVKCRWQGWGGSGGSVSLAGQCWGETKKETNK